MKIAVVHNSGSVGSWRWVCAVFGAIKKYYPKTEITIFCKKNVACPKDMMDVMTGLGLTVCDKFKFSDDNFRKYTKIRLIDKPLNVIRQAINNKSRRKFLDILNNNFDIAFNSWPFTMSAERLDIPYLFIPHDFIFTHYFGHHVGNRYNRPWWKSLRKTLKGYIDAGCIPCVTTNYIGDELRRTVPEYTGPIHQVLIVPSDNMKAQSPDVVSNVMKKFGIDYEYILLATNDMHHKNSQAALTAYYYVKQKYPELKMVIIGYGTQGVRVKMNCPYYADHVDDDEDYDIQSLGLVTDMELNALMQNAKILLNVSLCEAGCGSGQDAWVLGIPTAISDIPPYKEQVATLGVKTEFFNPKNSEDIAAAVLRLLDNPKHAKENAKASQLALQTQYTEKDMADKYMAVFRKYAKRK